MACEKGIIARLCSFEGTTGFLYVVNGLAFRQVSLYGGACLKRFKVLPLECEQRFDHTLLHLLSTRNDSPPERLRALGISCKCK